MTETQQIAPHPTSQPAQTRARERLKEALRRLLNRNAWPASARLVEHNFVFLVLMGDYCEMLRSTDFTELERAAYRKAMTEELETALLTTRYLSKELQRMEAEGASYVRHYARRWDLEESD